MSAPARFPEFPAPFLDPGPLADDAVELRLQELQPADALRGWVASYVFGIHRRADGARAGRISLRLTDAERFLLYYGQIGYGVDAAHRGHGYASRAVVLLLPLARRHGMPELWVTCGPENVASRRTLERAGFRFVEVVAVPPVYQGDGVTGERCRYYRALGDGGVPGGARGGPAQPRGPA